VLLKHKIHHTYWRLYYNLINILLVWNVYAIADTFQMVLVLADPHIQKKY
jgi:hypothetical protein